MRTPFVSVFTTFILLASVAFGQHPPLVNSGELLEQGAKLYEERKYKEAIKVFSRISRSDTNYSRALHELSLTAYNDSNFQAAKRWAEEGLSRFPETATSWYSLLANAVDELGEREKAIQLYDKIIAEDPNDYQAHYNKGVTLLNMEKLAEAKASFQQCLLINPFYASAHYFLGYLAVQEGRIPEAMMCYAANLVVSPGNGYFRRSIRALSEISEMHEDVVKRAARRKPSHQDDFEMLQEIIVNKISLDKKYKLHASLEDPIVRQLQVMMEKLEYNAADKGFWMQYYVPFYTSLFAEDKFEPFVYHIFSQLDLKPIVTYVKRNEKQIDGLTTFAADYFTEIRATRQLDHQKRPGIKRKHFYSSNRLLGTGEAITKGKESVLVGDWEFYGPNGRLQSKGKFNENQEKTGPWEYYHSNGELKEKSTFVNDKAEGKSLSWFDNGLPSTESEYRDGELNGIHKEYFYNGQPRKTEQYKDGKREGLVRAYTVYGTLYYTLNFKEDKEDGELLYYYNNGKVQNSTRYVNGEAQGTYKAFYYSGKLQEEGQYDKNKKTGTWKEYYESGKLRSETNYLDDEQDGEAKLYYENGQLQKKSIYRKGKPEGKMEDYDKDGILFSDSYFEKGRLKDLKFYDKTGKVISTATSRNGAANLAFYDPYGNKTSEGYFTKEGLQSGKGTEYYKNGKVSLTAEYKDGLLDGLKTTWYRNGKKASEGEYTGNVENGYHTSYHITGKTSDEGWILEGKKQGPHLNYNKFGELKSRSWYLNDDDHGYTEYYHPNGKLDYEQRFDEGWIDEVIQYDTAGNVLSRLELPKGKGNFEFKLLNGKPYIKGAYSNYYLHGEYRIFFPDGSLSQLQYYRWGRRDSIYRSYFPGGILASEGRYSLGNKQGEWKYYHENGKLKLREQNVDGNTIGKSVYLNDDGTLDQEVNYDNNGVFQGANKLYGENNQLMIQFNYENGALVSYTYEGKDGKLVPAIPLKNGSGPVKAFYKNGNTSYEANFVEEEADGERKLYFSNGKPYIVGTRVDGYNHGTYKTWYPSGQLEKEEVYHYGTLHGTVTSFYPNGKPKSVETYHDGELHGDCKYYDPNGKLQVRTYFYQVLQSVK